MPPGTGFGAWRLRGLGDPDDLGDRPVDRETVRRAWGLARPFRRRLAGYVAIIVTASALGALPPLLIRTILDEAIPQGRMGLLWAIAGTMVAVAVGVAGLSLVERWLSSSIGERFILRLRVLLYEHVQRMPLAFFTRTQTGALITRLNNDVIGAQRALTGTLGGVIDNVISVGVTLVAMLLLDWQITLLALVLLPLFVVPARIVGRRLQEMSRESMALNADMNSVMTERFNVSGALLVKLFGRGTREVEVFSDKAGRVADIGVRQALHGRMLFASLGLVGSLATALVYLLGGRQVISGSLETGTVVALALYVTQLYGPLAQLSNARVDLMTALVSFERVFEVLDLPPAITEPDDATSLPDPRGDVALHDVSFRYPAAQGSSLASLEGMQPTHGLDASDWILSDVDVTAPRGTMTALVGPSGAGKTTLAMLLPRIHDVTEGSVTIDGVDVRDLSFDDLSHAVGVVTQDPHLFHDSIANNLRYAAPDATDAQLEAACRAARIHDVIARLPDGYDTIVGERGHRLSGGEKQRVAIARVILKDPAVVVLDEATAHLDSESERHVQAALADVLDDRTSFVIAHRLSTIVDADQILVLDDHRIVERGTHAELVAKQGIYAELARTQLAAA
ncbi:ABC transporter ATP-binding protein [Salsipaludibacter albus]|uniref:ABC transporter ATP-binding protein n=1 Tax=Salsipaludibacter albus TaxID=2849650 RepID=UPI001EE3DD36|nr:ABC transporter ATP-binding protein [Salsipaludibacter albus]MBY5162817.1 ABC transporter ATP-binding protein/permease [Salsipaludibacter albus]